TFNIGKVIPSHAQFHPVIQYDKGSMNIFIQLTHMSQVDNYRPMYTKKQSRIKVLKNGTYANGTYVSVSSSIYLGIVAISLHVNNIYDSEIHKAPSTFYHHMVGIFSVTR